MKCLTWTSCMIMFGLTGCVSTPPVSDYTGKNCESLRTLTRQYVQTQALQETVSRRSEVPQYDRDGKVKDPERHDRRDRAREDHRDQLSVIRAAYKSNGCTG